MTKKELIIVGILVAVLVTIIITAAKDKYGEADEEAYTVVDNINEEQEQVFSMQNYANEYESSDDTVGNKVDTKQTEKIEKMQNINIKINGISYVATLYNNEASNELIKMLPLKLTMSEMNKNEKYSYIKSNLTKKQEKVTDIKCGDIMLYESNCLTIFYDNFTTNRLYTKIGKIENAEELKDLSNYNNIEVEFSNVK